MIRAQSAHFQGLELESTNAHAVGVAFGGIDEFYPANPSAFSDPK
jgi:hypothetical protein